MQIKGKVPGFTFLELALTLIIISVFALISTSVLFEYYDKNQVDNDIVTLEQAVKYAKRIAMSSSSNVYVDLVDADVSQSTEDGGIIYIKNSQGTILETYTFGRNVKMIPSSSTVQNDQITFNYEGVPVDATDDPNGITSANNTIAIGYQGASSTSNIKSITVEPLTGDVQIY